MTVSAALPLSAVAVREAHVETWLGHRVRDPDGKKVGRIEEIIAEQRGTDWVVVEVQVGPGALLARLVELSTLLPLPASVRRRWEKRCHIAWDQLDLTDPSHPRTSVRRDELRAKGNPME